METYTSRNQIRRKDRDALVIFAVFAGLGAASDCGAMAGRRTISLAPTRSLAMDSARPLYLLFACRCGRD